MTSDQSHNQASSGSDPDSNPKDAGTASHDVASHDALAGIQYSPNDGSSAFSDLLPGGANFGVGTGSTSIDQQIQAFTAGLANTLGSSHADGIATSTGPSTSTSEASKDTAPLDPLAEFLSANPSLANSALATPHENFGTPLESVHDAGQDSGADVESLLASLGQLAQEAQDASNAQQGGQDSIHLQDGGKGQGQLQPLLLPNLSAFQPDLQSSETSSSGSDATASGYIDALLAEASRGAIAEAGSTASVAQANDFSSTFGDQPAPATTDATIAASLERFMASLQARVTSSLNPHPSEFPVDDEQSSVASGQSPVATKTKAKLKTPKPVKPAKPPKKLLGKRKYREIGPLERKTRVQRAVSAYLREIDPLAKPSLVTGPILSTNASTTKMTTIRCTHASVAQKSYGSEKRFLNPPPIVRVSGPLRRYADSGAAIATSSHSEAAVAELVSDSNPCGLSMVVKGEADEQFSNEQIATLDKSFETKVKSLYVTPTGRSKSFRLQLSMLRSSSADGIHSFAAMSAKRAKLSAGSPPPYEDRKQDGGMPPSDVHLSPGKHSSGDGQLSRLPSGLCWASFESAPVTIVSKSSKKTVKPRNSSAQISNGSMISLFNRINSQTARTKYVYAAEDGRLTAQNQEWSAFRVTLISRPPQADLASAEEGSVTYGSTIILTDIMTGASTEPLVVCKMDKGEVMLPQIDPPAEIGMAGSGMRSRRIPVSIELRGGALATDSGPINMMAAQNKSQDPIAATKPAIASTPASAGADGQLPSQNPSSMQAFGRGSGEDLNMYGPVGQLQKVALMRFVPRSEQDKVSGDSEDLESDFTGPRSYLCASVPDKWKTMVPSDVVGKEPVATSYVNTHTNGLDAPMPTDDVSVFDRHSDNEGNSLAFVTPATKVTAKEHGPGNKLVDQVDDTFAWSLIGISRFEFSFFDTSATEASKDEGPCEVPIPSFPLITSMPSYDPQSHTLSTTVSHFIVTAAITGDKVPLDVWVGPLGPCSLQHQPANDPGSDSDEDSETLISVKLPSVQAMWDSVRSDTGDPDASAAGATSDGATTSPVTSTAATATNHPPAHFLLPLLFVNDSDGVAFHSGRHVVCEDLVQLMRAAGHEVDAATLCQLGFGLGEVATPPKEGAWSVRII